MLGLLSYKLRQASAVYILALVIFHSSAYASLDAPNYTFAHLAPSMTNSIGLGNPAYDDYVSPVSPASAGPNDVSEQFLAPNGKLVSIVIKTPVTTGIYRAPPMPSNGNPITYFAQQIAAAGSGKILVIPNATYNFPAIDCTNKKDPQYMAQYILINQMQDMVIEGQGSLLNFASSCQGVKVLSSQRIIFRNFVIDWPNLQMAAVGTVTNVDAANNTYSLHLSGTHNTLPQFNVISAWGAPNDYFSLWNTLSTIGYQTPVSLTQNASQITENIPGANGVSYSVGESVIVRYVGSGEAFWAYQSQDITVDNIVVHAAPDRGFLFNHDRGVHINNCHVERRAGRIISSTGDAVHIVSTGDILIENSTFGFNGDDGININSRMLPVSPQPACVGQNSFCPATFNSGENNATDKDTVGLFDLSGKFITTEPVSCAGAGGTCTYDASPLAQAGGFLADMDKLSVRYMIRDTTVEFNRGYGVLLQSPYGYVYGNSFVAQTGLTAYLGQGEATWGEGPGAQDIIFANNLVMSNGLSWWGGAIEISSSNGSRLYSNAQAQGGLPPLPAINQNIVIAKNKFYNITAAAAYVSSANNVIIYQNELGKTNQYTTPTRFTPNVDAPIDIYDASNVSLLENFSILPPSEQTGTIALFDASDVNIQVIWRSVPPP